MHTTNPRPHGRGRLFLTLALVILFQCGRPADKIYSIIDPNAKLAQIKYAGLRSSWYGVDYPFTSEQWKTMSDNMSGFFPAPPQPTNVWIVGALMSPGICELEFQPADTNLLSYDHISFRTKKINHEQVLSCFDSAGVKVFLQVEPGKADVDTLINLVLSHFGNHSCVAGFGIDVEWLGVDSETNATLRVEDTVAQCWEQRVKSFNSSYRLFLKHWETSIMPPHYRGDIIFIDDSQGFPSMGGMALDFGKWANYFSPNPVMFQVGYDEDYGWWKTLSNPPKDIGDQIAMQVKSVDQEIGIIWVDFTLNPTNCPELSGLFAGLK
jgi:hypothetical protein